MTVEWQLFPNVSTLFKSKYPVRTTKHVASQEPFKGILEYFRGSRSGLQEFCLNVMLQNKLRTYFKGVMNCLFIILHCSLRSTYMLLILLLRFLHKKSNLEIIDYFLCCFDPLIRTLCLNRRGDCKLGSKCPLLWLANSCLCLTACILHR